MEKEVEIKVEGEKWEKALEEAFDKANKKVKIDGFRPGHAPKEVFLKKYKIESLYMDAADVVVDDAYREMLEQNKDLQIVAQPDMKVKEVNEKSITFTFTLTTKPEVKLGKYKDLGIKKEEIKVTKKEIEDEIEHMRSHYAESVVKDGAIEKGDTAIIDFEGFKDGVAFDGGKATNYSLEIGSNSFIPGFEDALIGLKANDIKDINLTFPNDYHVDDLKGKDVVFKVTIHEVKKTVIPELNEEFFEDLAMDGINSKETLEAQVKENLTVKKESEAENKYIDALLDAASKNIEVNIPHVMIHDELDRMIEQYKQNLSMQGLTIEQFYQFTNSNEEALKAQMHNEAETRVKIRLMLEEVTNKENITITDEAANKEAKELAKKYQMEENEFLKAFGGIEMVKYDLKMRKAIDVLKG